MIPFGLGFFKKTLDTVKCWTLFDGVNEKVRIDGISNYNFIQNTLIFSISFWVKLDDYTQNRAQYFMGNNGGTKSKKGFWIGYRGNSGDNIRIVVSNGNGIDNNSIVATTNNNAIGDNDWHNVVVTGDGIDAFIYVDNIKQSPTNTQGGVVNAIGDSTHDLALGHIEGFGGAGYIEGSMDEVAIWDTKLADGEVSEIYNLGREHKGYNEVSAGLISHWKMDTLDPIDEKSGFDGISIDMDDSNINCE